MECFWLSSYFLIDTIFETGPYWVQSKSQKNTILGHGGPSKVKLGNKEHLVAIKLFLNPKIPYPYEVNGKLVTGNDSFYTNLFLIAKFDCSTQWSQPSRFSCWHPLFGHNCYSLLDAVHKTKLYFRNFFWFLLKKDLRTTIGYQMDPLHPNGSICDLLWILYIHTSLKNSVCEEMTSNESF